MALIGSPVGHSGSPAMYNYSFQKLGLDYAYVAFDVKEDKVKDAIEAMKTFHMRGCNVTMPDKVEAVKYMDALSPAAQIIGAVNTIVNDDGKLTGHMTDGEGFVKNLKAHGIDVKGKKITVAGGGGAATATDGKDASKQTLLDTAVEGCYMSGVGDTSANSIGIAYDAIVTPVSEAVTNTAIASVLFIIAWDAV